jgi:hypothetical protein
VLGTGGARNYIKQIVSTRALPQQNSSLTLHFPSFHIAAFILLQRVTTYIMLLVMQESSLSFWWKENKFIAKI